MSTCKLYENYSLDLGSNELTRSLKDKLKTKQTIGTIERDEESGKTEVHFEIWKGNVMLNPELWIGKRN